MFLNFIKFIDLEDVKIISKLTELFINDLVKKSVKFTVQDKRKTIRVKFIFKYIIYLLF